MKKRASLLVIVFLCSCFHSLPQEDKLKKAKASLKSSSSGNSRTTVVKNSKSSKTSRANSVGDFENPFARAVWYIAAYSVYGVFFESPWEMNGKMHAAEISSYPYKTPTYGNFIYTNTTDYNITRFDVYNRFLIASKNLYGNDIGVDFRFLKRFAIDVNYTTFLEKGKGKSDSFAMFSSLLKYHRIRTQRFDAWFGVGFRHIFNDVKETRFLLGFGGEVFFSKPISLVASHKWATVNSQSVRNTRLLLKYHLKNYRISSGYEHYKLGVSNINSFSFGVEASF